jgi:hypothetical protein
MGVFLHLQETKYLWLVFSMTRALDSEGDGEDDGEETLDEPALAQGIKE